MTPTPPSRQWGAWLERLESWFEQEAAESEYLSHRENWTPRLRRTARLFLIVGAALGLLLGIALGSLAGGG